MKPFRAGDPDVEEPTSSSYHDPVDREESFNFAIRSDRWWLILQAKWTRFYFSFFFFHYWGPRRKISHLAEDKQAQQWTLRRTRTTIKITHCRNKFSLSSMFHNSLIFFWLSTRAVILWGGNSLFQFPLLAPCSQPDGLFDGMNIVFDIFFGLFSCLFICLFGTHCFTGSLIACIYFLLSSQNTCKYAWNRRNGKPTI